MTKLRQFRSPQGSRFCWAALVLLLGCAAARAEMADLIKSLRVAAAIAGPEARKLYLAAADEIERCHARLEIDHCHKTVGEALHRVEIPYSERTAFPDAVTCRDATIELLESP